jgi:RHS repeat-associated protein
VDNALGTIYWTANARDAELHLLQATAANGVITNQGFDPDTGRMLTICATIHTGTCAGDVASFTYVWDNIGRLSSRADGVESYIEHFCYDALNRLTNSAASASGGTCTSAGSGFTAKTIGYDALGDITSKSDAGTYAYPASGAGSVQPHAVSGITGTVNGVVNPTFAYDANGNMTSGDNRTMTYAAFNMAASVADGGTTLCFTYDSEHKRTIQVQTTATCGAPGSGASTTSYWNDPVTGAASEEYVSGTTTTWRDYITADGNIVVERFNTAGTITPVYFNTDHLGSNAVLSNAAGTVTERDSYDSWGRPRNANGTDATSCSIASAVTRGYTGQENMPAACAVNLNARLYDPTIARMMSADPTIPDPMDGQSFNRFSYVANNPLALTDPTGYVVNPPNPNIVNDLGPPCWGCSGAGTETNDSNGLPVDASGHPDCYSCSVQLVFTAPGGGEYVATYNKATGEFQSLAQVTNTAQTGNNMPVSAPALSDQFSGNSSGSSAPAGLTAGSSSYSPIEALPYSGDPCSPGSRCGHVTEVPDDANGGLNNGVYFGGIGPTYVNYYTPSGSNIRMVNAVPGMRITIANVHGADVGFLLGGHAHLTGTYQYYGVNGYIYTGTFTSNGSAYGIGGGGIVNGAGYSDSLDALFGPSSGTAFIEGFGGVSISNNSSGQTIFTFVGRGIGFVVDQTNTTPVGAPTAGRQW